MKKRMTWGIIIIFHLTVLVGRGAEQAPPPISSLMKPTQWKKILEDKEVISSANLQPLSDSPMKKYSFYSAMLVGNSVDQTRKVLTDYKLYTEMIPYINKAEYRVEDRSLMIEGGIWNFKLRSRVQFTEKSDRWIHYQIIDGHFTGLTGDIYFESKAEKGTAVYLAGEQIAARWPPRFVIERGAEIVFGFTAGRMRSYIESRKNLEKGAPNDRQRQEVPKPRSHI